jgi:hypothetical protein
VINIAALLWGFAEATIFFLVPDVLMTFAGSYQASVAALAGALIGGIVMHRWGSKRPQAARHFLLRIPAIHERLIMDVQSQLAQRGLAAVFIGPLRGIPYKIYAVEWAARGGALGPFLLISIPARYLRFFLATLVGSLLPAWILILFWILFYTWYFLRFR